MKLARLPAFASRLIREGMPRRVLLFGPLSLGDDLLCTAVLREARKRGLPFTMMSNRPELFAHNPDPAQVISIDDYFAAGLRRLGVRVVQPYYARAAAGEPERDLFPPGHILAEMCRLAGLRGEISLRPYLELTGEEKRAGQRHPRQIAIHSSAASARVPFATKEWGAGRLGEVARLLAPDFQLVQLGSVEDPLLPQVEDLRGKTSLREAAAILSASQAFVGLEGFLAHLARAVDCPAAVVFGGRVRPETCGYACNRNFYGPVSCAPCGLRNGCPYSLACMDLILPSDVAAAARELAQASRPDQLPAETAIIP